MKPWEGLALVNPYIELIPRQGGGPVTPFDPEGEDYDYETAKKYGIVPDAIGHWQSRVPQTGQILKGRTHKTFPLTIKGEEEAGYEIYKGEDGRYYSRQKKSSPLDPAIETTKAFLQPWGPVEAGLNLATQAYGLPAMGLVGIAGLPFGKSEPWSEAVGKALIYQPQTEAGRKVTEAVSVPFEMLGKGAEKIADVSREAGPPFTLTGGKPTAEDRALWGTIGGTAAMALPMFLGAKRGLRKPTTEYTTTPPGLVRGTPPVEPNPYMDLMETRISSLRRNVHGMLESPPVETLAKRVEEGSITMKQVPTRLRKFIPEKLTSERGSLEGQPKGWTSTLQSTIESKMPNQAPVEQIRGLIKGAGVKGDEIKWSGLDEYLQGKTGKVGKQEVMDYLKQNEVKVEEVQKGGYKDAYDAWLNNDAKNAPNKSREFFNSLSHNYKVTYEEMAIGQGGTKFSQWQLPGGENYRELLLTMPVERRVEVNPKGALYGMSSTDVPTYKSAHFDELDVLAHVRFNDRVDAQGKKVLFIEEVQSDWHQAGREKGYKGINDIPSGYVVQEKIVDGQKLYALGKPEAKEVGVYTGYYPKLEDAIREITKQFPSYERPPQAPFSKTWHEMAMRRMVRWASENGYDRVAWTTGEQQAARYDLSKQVDSVNYEINPNKTYNVGAIKDGRDVGVTQRDVPANKLSDYVGKDLAQKMIANEGKPIFNTGWKEFTGLDLKVGGEGMKGFYDKILPEYMNKFGKKWRAKVGEMEIPNAFDNPEYRSGRSEIPLIGAKVHSLDITPSMRSSVIKEGLPLFQLLPPVVAGAGLVGERILRKEKKTIDQPVKEAK